MGQYEWIGFFIIALFGLLLTAGPISHRFPKTVTQIIILAFLFRIIGSLVRYYVLYEYYDGGDAGPYYKMGVIYSGFIWNLDFSFFEQQYWELGRWWGTQMMMFISGFVISLIGPSQKGEFLFFSMISLCGLLFFAKAFQSNYSTASLKNYLRFLVLWPSLWFWPSSVGKDAVVLFATGLMVYGYTFRRDKIHWLALSVAIIIGGIIRPHVAGVMVVSLAIAHWLAPGRKARGPHIFQGILIAILLFVVLRQGLSQMGIDSMDVENFKSYVENVSKQTSQGGSAIATPGLTVLGIPTAIVNILFRPFPWEAGSIVSAMACAELLLFWGFVLVRRKRIVKLMRQWRQTKLLRLAVPLTILYTLMLGLAIGNLGIIARQRIHILPLLFIWLEAETIVSSREAAQPMPERKWIRGSAPLKQLGARPG